MKRILLALIPAFCYFNAGAQFTSTEITKMVDDSRQLRALIQSDPHRPGYHFVAPEGHTFPFDPNGAIFWNGKYHLGYIYQTRKNGKQEHVWGHAVSTDLFHWTLYPNMLDVQQGDIEKGIFSGGAFLSKEGVPHIMYHGEGSGTNLVAYSTDPDLKTWKKFEGNPVLRTSGQSGPMRDDGANYIAWDPEGWYDQKAGAYYQISGGKRASLFKSADMYKWDYLGDLIDSTRTFRYESEDLSCPDMFRIGNKSMLLFISHNLGTQYYIGNFANDKYTVEQHGRMNWPGGTFFAPEQLVDDKGRNIIWGWVLERKPENLKDYGWSGIMSLPRVLTLGPSNELQINPAAEVKSLRLAESNDGSFKLAPGTEKTLSVKGRSIELEIELSAISKGVCGIKILCSPDGKEQTVIRYEPEKGELVIDFIQSSVQAPVKMSSHCILEPTIPGWPETVSEQRAPFRLRKGETLRLNIFVDNSIIEVFVNGRQCLTQVVYPELVSSELVKVFSGSEPLTIRKATGWKMAPSNAY